MSFWRVPQLWRGETLAILASGPSLTQDQATLCRGRVRVVAINDSYLLAPWADMHYFCDAKWYGWHRTCQAKSQALFGHERALALFHGFQGLRVTLEPSAPEVQAHDPSVRVLRNDSRARDGGPYRRDSLCLEPDGLRTGSNSGHQAINLAVHTGVKRILLLGYDMRLVDGRTHWFGDHPTQNQNQQIYETQFRPALESLVRPLKELGIEVINCTPDSAAAAFPLMSLNRALRI